MMRKTAESRPEPWPEAACGEAEGDTYCVNDAGHTDDHHFRSRGWIEIRLFPVNGDTGQDALDNSPEEVPQEEAVPDEAAPEEETKKPPFGGSKTALTNRPFQRDMVYLKEDVGRLPVKLWRVVSIAGEDIKVQGPYQRSEGGFAPIGEEYQTVTKEDIVGVGGQFRTAANPYSPEGNPYNDPAPGIPDDMMDGPPMEEPVSDIPMTTRPRQMPSGGGGEAGGEAESISTDPAITPEQEVVLGALGVLPLVCRSSGRKFAARVTPGLRCACGKRDYDLQSEAMEFDPQFDNRISLMPEADMLPENDQFAVPFTDDSEPEFEDDDSEDEVKEGKRKTAAGGHSTTVTPSPASEPGALDGYAINCSDCGYVGGYSLKTMADIEARRHTKYMAEWESRRVSRMVAIVRDIRSNNKVSMDQARRMAMKAIWLQDGVKS